MAVQEYYAPYAYIAGIGAPPNFYVMVVYIKLLLASISQDTA